MLYSKKEKKKTKTRNRRKLTESFLKAASVNGLPLLENC